MAVRAAAGETAGRRPKLFSAKRRCICPDKEIPYEELFYRQSDAIVLQARTVELVDRGYRDVRVRLSPAALEIGEEKLNPDEVPCLEAVSAEIVLPREAMGLGDVKFMGAIGAFIGWQGVFFTLTISSMIGALYGATMVALKRREWSGRLYFGPFIALAAAIWIFAGGIGCLVSTPHPVPDDAVFPAMKMPMPAQLSPSVLKIGEEKVLS